MHGAVDTTLERANLAGGYGRRKIPGTQANHMKYPRLALEIVSSITKELLIVQTAVDMLGTRRSAMAFNEKDELGNDPTNWRGPNPGAVVAMFR